MTEREKFMLALACIAFVVCFAVYFVYGFFINCVFHWPIRWDVDTCSHEQMAPAQYKAVQAASNFVPN